MSKAKLADMANRMKAKPAGTTTDDLIANPQHGDKGDFVKVTITLPPSVYQRVMEEATRRKVNKEPNPAISAIIREALVEMLKP